MLPCVCSVIDHRWRQNVVRTKKWHTRRSRVCHWCSYDILTSSVIYYWTDAWRLTSSVIYYWIRRTATWNLFVLYNNEKPFYFKILQHNMKASILPRLCPPLQEKKPVDVIYDGFKMKQFHWLLCIAKNCDWSRKIVPLSNLTRASLLYEWKLTPKAELNCEIYKSWRKCWKNQVSFFHRSSPVSRKAWTIALKITGVEKIPSENLWLRST